MEKNYISPMIAQIAATGKFLEFTDGLVPAYKKNYAMMQGSVGKEYAPNSGIRVSITDYSGEKAVTKNVLVPCYVFDEIENVCLKNTGSLALMDGSVPQAVKTVFSTGSAVGNVWKSLALLVNEGLGALASVVKGESESPAAFGKALKNVRTQMAGMKTAADGTQMMQVPFGVDYSYSQVRVFSDRVGADGLCPCNTLTISRKSVMTGKDGNPVIGQDGKPVVMKKPWNVQITTFMAKPVKHDNGTVSYSGSTAKDKVNLACTATDAEMHKAVWSVNHFIAQWERSQLGAFIEGKDAREAQYAERK